MTTQERIAIMMRKADVIFKAGQHKAKICKNCIYYEYGKDPQPYCNCAEDTGKLNVEPTDCCEYFEQKVYQQI